MRRILFAVLSLSMLLILSGCGTAIPEVKGMTAAQATKAIEDAGFQVGKVTYDEKASGVSGDVIAQTPESNERAKDSSLILLTVAGPPPVTTPKLTGLDQDQATVALEAGGLSAGQAIMSYDASVAVGKLVSQDPSAGKAAPKGSSVALVFSKGPEPVVLPAVAGKMEAEARKLLESAGFKVEVESKSDEIEKGIVISQEPSTNTAQPDTSVTITVSTGVEMIRVPNIHGMINPDPVLTRAGLRPKGIPIHGPIESDAAGYMEAYRQNPRAGTLIPRGSTVTYHFWWESQ